MKKIFTSIVALTFLTLCGCNSGSQASDNLNGGDSNLYLTRVLPRLMINKDEFDKNNGYEYFKKKSLQTEFLGVGKLMIGDAQKEGSKRELCNATLISQNSDMVYLLTSASCVLNAKPSALFTAWNDSVIADGEAKVFIPKDNADIAVVSVPRVGTIVDENNLPIMQPIIYDEDKDIAKKVEFVGHGMQRNGHDLGLLDFPFPPFGRLWGQSGPVRLASQEELNSIKSRFSMLVSEYISFGETDFWAKPTFGDEGSAWWQEHESKKVIVAVTNSFGYFAASGVRVSDYAAWIKRIVPDAKLFSEVIAAEKDEIIKIKNGVLKKGKPQITTVVPGKKYLIEYSFKESELALLTIYDNPNGIISFDDLQDVSEVLLFDGKDENDKVISRSFHFIPKSHSVDILYYEGLDSDLMYKLSMID